jgi:hypothetical protein
MIPRKHAAVEDKERMSFENEAYLRRLFREPSEMICLNCGLTGNTTSPCATTLQIAAAAVDEMRDKASGTGLEIVNSEQGQAQVACEGFGSTRRDLRACGQLPAGSWRQGADRGGNGCL